MKIVATMVIFVYLFYCRGLIYQTISLVNSTIFFVIISSLMNQTPLLGSDSVGKRLIERSLGEF